MSLLQELMLSLRTKAHCDFIESMIAYFGAPVLAGAKCASLINLTRAGAEILGDWLATRDALAEKMGVRFAEISVSERSILLLVYREYNLLRALSAVETRCFLVELGYDASFETAELYVERLIERFREGIPHEVGLFLDYPLEDVRGFIENGGKNAKFSGYWKVYGNEIHALRKFEAYRRAEWESARALLGKPHDLVEVA